MGWGAYPHPFLIYAKEAGDSVDQRSYSRDPKDHIGFLRQWAAQMKRGGLFSKWDMDELFSQAYLTTADLLARNYDPEKGTIITYLKSFLWPRVNYAYGKYHGWRYRDSKWVFLEKIGPVEDRAYLPDQKAELPPNLTEEEIDIILMRVGGMSYQAIAHSLGYKSATTISSRIRKTIYLKFKEAGLLLTD